HLILSYPHALPLPTRGTGKSALSSPSTACNPAPTLQNPLPLAGRGKGWGYEATATLVIFSAIVRPRRDLPPEQRRADERRSAAPVWFFRPPMCDARQFRLAAQCSVVFLGHNRAQVQFAQLRGRGFGG